MHTINWEGVFPAMLTPFTADDKLDFALFEKNVNAQVEAGMRRYLYSADRWVKAVRWIAKKKFSCWFMLQK